MEDDFDGPLGLALDRYPPPTPPVPLPSATEPSHWEFVAGEGDTISGKKTYRLAVPGGWLYRVDEKYMKGHFALTFVPDPSVVPGASA